MTEEKKLKAGFIDEADGLLKGNGICLFSAWYNQAHAYKDLSLTIVHGSLGFGMGDTPFFEYGGKDRTVVKDFVNTLFVRNGPPTFDMHTWLEDDQGNVYDVVQSEWDMISNWNGQQINVQPWQAIQGMTKADLQKVGLHYVGAPPATQIVLESMMQRLYPTEYSRNIFRL